MKLVIDGEHAVLHSRATPRILAIVGSLEGRRHWIQNSQALKIEATRHNIDTILSMGGIDVENMADAKVIPEMEQFVNRIPYREKTKSLDHQARCRERMKGKDIFGVFFEQGLGKTKTLLDKAGELYCAGKITGLIVVTVKGVSRQWIMAQAPKHLNCEWSGVFWPFNHEQLPTKGLQILAFHYDGLSSKRGLAAALEFAKKHKGRLMIVADESQNIKNDDSVRHSSIMELYEFSSHRYLSTGTPIAKDLLDEWNQFKFLNSNIIGIKYVTTFRKKYCNMGGFGGKTIFGYRNLEEFKAITEPYCMRVTKEEIGMIPKQYDEWVIDLLPVQRAAIRQIREDLEVTISDRTIDIKTALVAASKIQQISSGFMLDEFKNIHLIVPIADNPRLEGMVDWINSREGDKFIIWAKYKQDIRMITERLQLEKISFVEYHGGTGDKDRVRNIESFLREGGAQGFISNPMSGGTGLELQGLCQREMYYSNTHRYLDRVQSEDRIHRIGMLGPITVTDMIARGSMDRSILRNLQGKKGLSELVLGDLLLAIKGEMK